MIERYTIKFGPAVSQKELQNMMFGGLSLDELRKAQQMKVKIELISDVEDIQRITELLKEHSKK